MSDLKTLSDHIVDDERSMYIGFIHVNWVKECFKLIDEDIEKLKSNGKLDDFVIRGIINKRVGEKFK